MVRVIQFCWQRNQFRPDPNRKLSAKPVWHIPLLCVQWKTRDDGHRACPKHVEIYSKNKFEKFVHLVGFIIRIITMDGHLNVKYFKKYWYFSLSKWCCLRYKPSGTSRHPWRWSNQYLSKRLGPFTQRQTLTSNSNWLFWIEVSALYVRFSDIIEFKTKIITDKRTRKKIYLRSFEVDLTSMRSFQHT